MQLTPNVYPPYKGLFHKFLQVKISFINLIFCSKHMHFCKSYSDEEISATNMLCVNILYGLKEVMAIMENLASKPTPDIQHIITTNHHKLLPPTCYLTSNIYADITDYLHIVLSMPALIITIHNCTVMTMYCIVCLP